MYPEYKFTDEDVRTDTELQFAAVRFLLTYRGDFEFLVDAKMILMSGGNLAVNVIRGTLNCMLNSPEGMALIDETKNHTGLAGEERPQKTRRLKVVKDSAPEEKYFGPPKFTWKGIYLVPVKPRTNTQYSHINRDYTDKYGDQKGSQLRYIRYNRNVFIKPGVLTQWEIWPSALCKPRLGTNCWEVALKPKEGYPVCPRCIAVEEEWGTSR